MAIYEYFCPKCKREFELMRPISKAEEPALCPQCHMPAEKLISVFASKADFYLKVPEKGAFRKTAEDSRD